MSPGAAAGSQPAGMRSGAGEYMIELTGYSGYEEQVLRLRNVNRSVAQTGEFLDWRYRILPGLPPPRVAWLLDPAGCPVGMAAAIFRSFCIDGVSSAVGVLGDISLDKRLRGAGFGQRLLAGLSRDLEHMAGGGGRGFVIPTEAARRSLKALGWCDAGQLIPHVCLVDPSVQLTRRLGSGRFAAVLAWPVRAVLSLAARLQQRRGGEIELADDFDEQFDALWSSLPKTGLILGDRSRATLCWRYRDHPSRRFRIARFLRAGVLRGYVIFEMAEGDSELSIQDMVVAERGDLPCMLALFVSWCLGQHRLGTARVSLSEGHPHAASLWRLGFVPRAPQGRFQVLDGSSQGARFAGRWCLTAGDKDI